MSRPASTSLATTSKGTSISVATGNTLNSNTIAGNGIYGVYRFESPNNPVAMRPQRHPNKFHGNVINLEDYIKSLNGNTQLPRPHSRFHSKKASKARQGPPRRVIPRPMARPITTPGCRIPCGRGSPPSSATGSYPSGSSMPPCASALPRAAVRRGPKRRREPPRRQPLRSSSGRFPFPWLRHARAAMTLTIGRSVLTE